jgi:glycosyltransferase involved in cell wall biosynthesis
MSATVIIPTTGSPELKTAIQSVLDQTYKDVTCYVVIDGDENYDATMHSLLQFNDDRLQVSALPINVGAKGFYGHRVYAAFSHLVNTDYVLYLDQDNWLYQSHIQSCVDTIEKTGLDWAYSLRQIHEKDGTFICFDDCESLGKYQSYHGINHIDTNCYCVKTEVASKISNVWHGGWGQDRIWLATLSKYFPKFDCTGEYTVHYRVNGNKGSVNSEFFDNGNKVMNDKYNGVYPWRKKI